ncbi:uncharacterized protein LOC107209749 [Parus major]|uniref:uncharacterized protein LOC107209749 n=1 Tax=Parus major TaxID=9157 RepID=UPI001443C812|nr:uncharacterized protein LOC107209749 [Parus major]
MCGARNFVSLNSMRFCPGKRHWSIAGSHAPLHAQSTQEEAEVLTIFPWHLTFLKRRCCSVVGAPVAGIWPPVWVLEKSLLEEKKPKHLDLSRKDLAVSQLLWAIGFMNVSWEEDNSVEPKFQKHLFVMHLLDHAGLSTIQWDVVLNSVCRI